MKRAFLFLLISLIGFSLFAQQNTSAPPKFALVIGNSEYRTLTPLKNPVNDANDIAAALQAMGFTVEKILDGSLDQMESAVMRLRNRLSVNKNSYGFFFFAGHGVQAGGTNFLIPSNANIPGENFLRERALSVQAMLSELNDAGNELNIVVLDACRDNPFGWARSGSRGLSVVSHQPADSIIVYATSAGSVAADGTGKNGLFTEHFLTHLKTPGLEVNEIFRRTMGDVSRASRNQQRPAVYNQYPGTAVLNSQANNQTPQSTPAPTPAASGPPITIVNNTGYEIYYLYISPVTSNTWGPDRLASNQTIPDKQSVTVNLPHPISQGNKYDIMVEDLDEDTYTKYNVTVTANGRIVFTFDDFDDD